MRGPDDTAIHRQGRHRPSMPTSRPSVSPDVRTICLICVIERLGRGWRHGAILGLLVEGVMSLKSSTPTEPARPVAPLQESLASVCRVFS